MSDSLRDDRRNVGHGHVYPRPDGIKARCGGPSMCNECAKDYVRKHTVQEFKTVQPPPIKNDNPAIQDLVLADVTTRKTIGLEKYGTLLQADNGRDMLKDAYEECLDLCIYLRGALYERDRR